MKKPSIGITIGDPSGIGPEVVLKALSTNITQKANFIVIGDKRVISTDKAEILDLKNINPKTLVMGEPSAETGKASLDYIMEAFKLIKEKKIDAMVTGPICKSAIQKAGCKFMGHTDLLAHLTRRNVGMMFVAGNLKIVLATIHIPLSKVCRMITEKMVYETIRLTHNSLVGYFRIKEPKICVLGFNPHSGEDKIMGKEEGRIKEAIDKANNNGIRAFGPFPPDTAFLKEGFDCFVAMYHDQGLIPLKLLAFDRAVNLTIGIPFIRTSPDHGCAFDIAGKNKANPSSMISAINLAIKLNRNYSPFLNLLSLQKHKS
ncbi:MAG: 4-hydroxythreonine-4-phosphate dehydrogenase PdxA [bacterium]